MGLFILSKKCRNRQQEFLGRSNSTVSSLHTNNSSRAPVKAQLNRLLSSWFEGLFLAVHRHRGRSAYRLLRVLPFAGFFVLESVRFWDKYSSYLFQNSVSKLRLSDKDRKSRLHNGFEIELLQS